MFTTPVNVENSTFRHIVSVVKLHQKIDEMKKIIIFFFFFQHQNNIMKRTLIKLCKDIQLSTLRDIEEAVALSAIEAAKKDKSIRRVEMRTKVGDLDFKRFHDLPIDKWQYPSDEIEEGTKYINPAPLSTYNPRPGVWDAVRHGDPSIVEKTLKWEWVESFAGDGLSVTLDPTASLCNGSMNEFNTVTEIIKKPIFNHESFNIDIQNEKTDDCISAECSSTSLGFAVRHNRLDIVKLLLNNRLCNPNALITFYNLEPNTYVGSKVIRFSKVRKTDVPLRNLPQKSSFNVSMSPLYYSFMKGYSEIQQLLLNNPRLDPRIGIVTDPRSKISSRPCSAYQPELSQRETDLENQHQLYANDSIRSADWIITRNKKGSDSQHMQAHSYGIRRN